MLIRSGSMRTLRHFKSSTLLEGGAKFPFNSSGFAIEVEAKQMISCSLKFPPTSGCKMKPSCIEWKMKRFSVAFLYLRRNPLHSNSLRWLSGNMKFSSRICRRRIFSINMDYPASYASLTDQLIGFLRSRHGLVMKRSKLKPAIVTQFAIRRDNRPVSAIHFSCSSNHGKLVEKINSPWLISRSIRKVSDLIPLHSCCSKSLNRHEKLKFSYSAFQRISAKTQMFPASSKDPQNNIKVENLVLTK